MEIDFEKTGGLVPAIIQARLHSGAARATASGQRAKHQATFSTW